MLKHVGKEEFFVRELFKKYGDNVCDRYMNGNGIDFFRKLSVELRGEVKVLENGGLSGVSVKE